MAKTSPFVPVALVVEDDVMQREMVAMLLQESEMGVIQCKTPRRRSTCWKRWARFCRSLLAHFTHQHYPNINVIVTSGRALTKELPDGATFMPKPWMALDLLREAERSQH